MPSLFGRRAMPATLRLPDRRRRKSVTSRHLGAELGILAFELEHLRDPCEVQPAIEQLPYATQPVKVVCAVAPRAAVGAIGFQQAACLIEPKVLYPHPDQLRGHRDPVHTTREIRARWSTVVLLPGSVRTLCR